MRSAPASTQRVTTVAGSSSKIVTSSMRPWRRRTHWPFLMSIAGMSNTSEASKNVTEKGLGGAVPLQEVGQQLQARGLAFFRVELHGKHVFAQDDRSKAYAVLGGAGHMLRIIRHDVVAVHEVKPAVGRD